MLVVTNSLHFYVTSNKVIFKEQTGRSKEDIILLINEENDWIWEFS